MAQWIWDATGANASASQAGTTGGNHWRELYRAALLELDLDKLGERVSVAEEAIHA